MILDGAGDGGTEAAKKKVEKDDGYVRSYADDVDTLSVTFRSVLLSLIACVLGSTISAITLFRQSGSLNLSGSVIQILSYIIGTAWAKWLPSVPIDEGRVDQRRPLTKWQKVVHFVNPGPFTIKEHAVIAIVSSCRVNEVFNPFIVHKVGPRVCEILSYKEETLITMPLNSSTMKLKIRYRPSMSSSAP